jgi:uncharacterized membrane protein
MAKKHKGAHKAHKPSSKEVDDGKVFAFLGAFLTILGFIIVLLVKKDNKYAMYYAKQGLVVFIACIVYGIGAAIIGAIATALAFIPVLGWLLGLLLAIAIWILGIVLLVVWVISWINALSGKEKLTPFVGQYADKFDI